MRGADLVAAWGGGLVAPLGLEWWCLGLTQRGEPAHPLFRHSGAALEPFAW